MNFLYKSIVLFLMAGLLFTACQKDSIDEVVPVEEPTFEPDTMEVTINALVTNLESNTNEGLDLGCFTIVYPFDLLLASENTITINSEADFIAALDADLPDQVVDFVFPLTIIDDNGETFEVTDNETLEVLFASCIPDDGWDDIEEDEDLLPAFLLGNIEFCFDLSYPLDLVDGDGNTSTAEDEEALIDLIVNTEELFFALPMTVIVEESGEALVINTPEDFYNAYFECDNIDAPYDSLNYDMNGFACFDLIFPTELQAEDGTTFTVSDENEFADLILSNEYFEFIFPLTLINPDGEEVTYESEEELFFGLQQECGLVIIIIEPTDPCNTPAHVTLFYNAYNIFTLSPCPFEINYPMEVTLEGQTYEINGYDDYAEVNPNPFLIEPIELVYPFSITMDDSGEVVTFNSDDEVCTFFSECE